MLRQDINLELIFFSGIIYTMSQATASYESALLKGVDSKTIDSSIRREALRALSNKVYYSLKPSSGALIKSRRTVSYAAQTISYTAGSVINIKVSANGYLDMSNSYLRWKVCTNRRNVVLKSTTSLINRLRIEASSNVIEDLENYNTYCKVLADHSVSDEYKRTAMAVDGYRHDFPRSLRARFNGTVANTNDNTIVVLDNVAIGDDALAEGTNVDPDGLSKHNQLYFPEGVTTATGNANDEYGAPVPRTVFCTPLYGSGFCSLQQYIPKAIGSLDFQITLENANIACIAANGTPNYFVREVELVCDVIQLADDINAMIDRLAMEGKLTLAFDTFMRSAFTLRDSGTTNLNLTKFAANVKSVFTYLRPALNVSPLTTNVHQVDSFRSVNAAYVASFSHRIDDAYFPVKPVDSVGQAYLECALKGFNKFNHILYPAASFQDFIDGGKHIIAVDLERDPSSAFTGYNCRGARSIVLTLTHAAANVGAILPPTVNADGNVDAQCFIVFTRTLTIMPSQNYVIAE